MQQHPDGGDPANEPPSDAASTEPTSGGPGTGANAAAEASQPLTYTAPTERAPHRAADRPAATETRPEAPAPRRTSSIDHDIEVRRVRLDEIDGVDEDITQFLRENDVLVEVSMQSDRWSLPITRIAVQNNHLPVWYRRGRLVHLGSGKALTVARRLAHHDDLLPVSIVQTKTLSLQQKLNYIAYELEFLPALHRPGNGYSAAAVALWRALEKAGVTALKRPGLREFAAATGLSVSALKPHWAPGED
jgi:hypothetical protein